MKELLDNALLSVPPTKENLSKYPTIIELLEVLSEREEDSMRTMSPLYKTPIYHMSQKGLYEAIAGDNEGEIIVMPTGRSMFTLFRGESEYHPICVPSIYRSQRPEKQLLDRLHTCELQLLLNSHPIINYIANVPVSYIGLKPIHLKVDYEGLAQHYEIPTQLFDFSNDKWIAAFFAVTKCESNIYSPVNPQEYHSSYGVLYVQELDEELMAKLRPIGLQYFRRPTVQCGFVVPMQECENLNDKTEIKTLFFRHDYEASCLVYEMSAQGRKLFPKDTLVEKALQIKELKSVSLSASTLCKALYYSHLSDEDFYNKLAESDIQTIPLPIISFNRELIQQEWEDWQHGEKERYIKSLSATPIICNF